MLQTFGLSFLLLLALATGANGQVAPSIAQARTLMTQGRLEEAQRELDTLALLTPEPAGVERLRGILAYENNRLTDADAAFTRAAAQDPADLDSLQMRGVVLFRMGRPADAIPLLEQAHSQGAIANADPNYVLGLCYLDISHYDDARHAFAAQYQFGPESAEAWLITARMMFRQQLDSQAVNATQRAIQIKPQLPLAHKLLGEIRLAEGDVPGAITALDQERAINPLDGETYERLGDAYSRNGQYAQAQQVLDRAVLLEPNASGPFILLGKTLLAQQDPAMAVQYLQRAAQIDPTNSMTHMLLARAFTAVGRKDDASREFEILQRLHQSGKSTAAP